MEEKKEKRRRLKKFERDRGAFTRLEIQARDIEILRSLAQYRFLDTLHIKALHSKDMSQGDRRLKSRLQKLFHFGLIDRPPQQLSYLRPPGPMVYALGNKGADFLAEEAGYNRGEIDWTIKNREAKDRYIQHALMVSNFRVVLTLALNNHGQARITDWQQGRELRDYVKLKEKKIAIVPDAFFTIEDPNDKMYFFLEADQSTMTRGRFLKKMKAYWQWWKEGGQGKKFGIKSFRVLTLCKTLARTQNLRQIAKEADDYKKGSLMFWFSLEKDIDLSYPERILKPIWQTQKDNEYHSLLE